MTDFSVYFKKEPSLPSENALLVIERQDEWEDQLERAIAFHLIGTHRPTPAMKGYNTRFGHFGSVLKSSFRVVCEIGVAA